MRKSRVIPASPQRAEALQDRAARCDRGHKVSDGTARSEISNRVSEVLNKKGKLTVEMMRALRKHLSVPADSLLNPWVSRADNVKGNGMVKWSIVLGVLGVFGTGAIVLYPNRWVSDWGPRQYWLVGLMALFPAWLIAFLGLLPSTVGPEDDPLPRSALLSSVVGLLGVVFTDAAARRLDNSGYFFSPFKYWLLGLAALLPAWLIALWILL
jgi:hypothetical protein